MEIESFEDLLGRVRDLNFNSVCRLCMEANRDFVGIFIDDVLPKQIIDVLGIKVSKDDKFPKNVCTCCKELLKNFELFKSQCQKVDNILKRAASYRKSDQAHVESSDCNSEIQSTSSVSHHDLMIREEDDINTLVSSCNATIRRMQEEEEEEKIASLVSSLNAMKGRRRRTDNSSRRKQPNRSVDSVGVGERNTSVLSDTEFQNAQIPPQTEKCNTNIHKPAEQSEIGKHYSGDLFVRGRDESEMDKHCYDNNSPIVSETDLINNQLPGSYKKGFSIGDGNDYANSLVIDEDRVQNVASSWEAQLHDQPGSLNSESLKNDVETRRLVDPIAHNDVETRRFVDCTAHNDVETRFVDCTAHNDVETRRLVDCTAHNDVETSRLVDHITHMLQVYEGGVHGYKPLKKPHERDANLKTENGSHSVVSSEAQHNAVLLEAGFDEPFPGFQFVEGVSECKVDPQIFKPILRTLESELCNGRTIEKSAMSHTGNNQYYVSQGGNEEERKWHNVRCVYKQNGLDTSRHRSSALTCESMPEVHKSLPEHFISTHESLAKEGELLTGKPEHCFKLADESVRKEQGLDNSSQITLQNEIAMSSLREDFEGSDELLKSSGTTRYLPDTEENDALGKSDTEVCKDASDKYRNVHSNNKLKHDSTSELIVDVIDISSSSRDCDVDNYSSKSFEYKHTYSSSESDKDGVLMMPHTNVCLAETGFDSPVLRDEAAANGASGQCDDGSNVELLSSVGEAGRSSIEDGIEFDKILFVKYYNKITREARESYEDEHAKCFRSTSEYPGGKQKHDSTSEFIVDVIDISSSSIDCDDDNYSSKSFEHKHTCSSSESVRNGVLTMPHTNVCLTETNTGRLVIDEDGEDVNSASSQTKDYTNELLGADEESKCPSVEESYCPSVEESGCPSFEVSGCPSVGESYCPSVGESYCPSVGERYCPSVEEDSSVDDCGYSSVGGNLSYNVETIHSNNQDDRANIATLIAESGGEKQKKGNALTLTREDIMKISSLSGETEEHYRLSKYFEYKNTDANSPEIKKRDAYVMSHTKQQEPSLDDAKNECPREHGHRKSRRLLESQKLYPSVQNSLRKSVRNLIIKTSKDYDMSLSAYMKPRVLLTRINIEFALNTMNGFSTNSSSKHNRESRNKKYQSKARIVSKGTDRLNKPANPGHKNRAAERRKCLENVYRRHKYLTPELYTRLQKKLNVSRPYLCDWFCHRRKRDSDIFAANRNEKKTGKPLASNVYLSKNQLYWLEETYKKKKFRTVSNSALKSLSKKLDLTEQFILQWLENKERQQSSGKDGNCTLSPLKRRKNDESVKPGRTDHVVEASVSKSSIGNSSTTTSSKQVNHHENKKLKASSNQIFVSKTMENKTDTVKVPLEKNTRDLKAVHDKNCTLRAALVKKRVSKPERKTISSTLKALRKKNPVIKAKRNRKCKVASTGKLKLKAKQIKQLALNCIYNKKKTEEKEICVKNTLRAGRLNLVSKVKHVMKKERGMPLSARNNEQRKRRVSRDENTMPLHGKEHLARHSKERKLSLEDIPHDKEQELKAKSNEDTQLKVDSDIKMRKSVRSKERFVRDNSLEKPKVQVTDGRDDTGNLINTTAEAVKSTCKRRVSRDENTMPLHGKEHLARHSKERKLSLEDIPHDKGQELKANSNEDTQLKVDSDIKMRKSVRSKERFVRDNSLEKLKVQVTDGRDDTGNLINTIAEAVKSTCKEMKKRQNTSVHLKCPICCKIFLWESRYKNHLSWCKKQEFKCFKCSKVLATRQLYSKHVSFMCKAKKFQCPKCKKKLISAVSLRFHMLRHSKVKDYKCEVCGKRFSAESFLKQHQLFHSKIRKYKCDICGKRFPHRSGIHNHLRIHENEI